MINKPSRCNVNTLSFKKIGKKELRHKPLYTKEEAQTIINEYKNLQLENQILQHEEFPINVNLEQKLNFIFKFRKDYPIEILCKVLDVNRSTYYKHFYNELQQEKE